jgi:hypothetical protein
MDLKERINRKAAVCHSEHPPLFSIRFTGGQKEKNRKK